MKNEYTQQKEYLTVKEIANMFGLSPVTVERLARKGQIPAVKIGWQWRIPAKEFQAWLQKQRGGQKK